MLARIRTVLVLSILIGSLFGSSSAKADHETWQGTFTQYTYTAPNPNNTRVYKVYVPANLPPGPRPLYVYLHGCTQTADQAARGIGLNHLADVHKFIAVYPQQNIDQSLGQASGNGIQCWNWFYPNRISRTSGEPSTIAGITQRVLNPNSIHGLNVDPRRVFISGASAGADMAVIMGATYPDLYASIASMAGCAYYVCTDATGELAYMAMGANERVMSVFVAQGSADPLNNAALSEGLVQQWLGTDDLADDGQANLSIPRVPQTEVRSSAPGDGNGYNYTIDHYFDGNDCALIDFYLIQRLGHNYPHGSPHGNFTDPQGPDITLASYQFFMAHPMPEPGKGDSCHAPVAADDSALTAFETSIDIDVLGNDTDADGDPLTVTSVTTPANGTVVNHGTSVTYSPASGFAGVDTFNYTVNDGDGNGGTDTAQVTVTVAENPNGPPNAAADSAATDEDTAVDIDVLANDTDPDGDSLSVGSVSQGSHGSVTNNGTDVTYTPALNYNGSDSFSYQACDSDNACSSATVEVNVNAVNDQPSAADDLATTDEDTGVTVQVLVNDGDLDGDALSVSSVTQGANGSVTNNLDGTVTYTPEANFNGADTFGYQACDPDGACDAAQVNVAVNAAGDAPDAADDSATTDEDTAVTIDVLTNDSDPDGDSLSVGLVTQGAHGTVTNNGTDVTYSPQPGYYGPDSFSYQACDAGGACDSAKVSVTVTPVNDSPSPSNDLATTNEDNAVVIDVLTNDADPEGDPLSVGSVAQGSNGSVTNNGNGTVTYTPNLNFNGTDSFSYQACDPDGACEPAMVNVTVNPVNDDPTATDDSAATNEDTSVTIDVLANDTDPDGDSLIVGSVTQGAHAVVINNGGNVTYTPEANYNGSDAFSYESCDPFAACVAAMVNVTVAAVNDPPSAADDSAATNKDTPVEINVLANDSDVDGDSLTLSSTGSASHGSVTNNGGSVTYSPDPGFSGIDTFEYEVSDGHGGFDTAMVTVEVGSGPAPGGKFIFAKALDDHACNLLEWHFVINQIRAGASAAPSSIRVTWEDGQSLDVALTKFSGSLAHYATNLKLDRRVVSARAVINDDWSGEFNLSYGPC